MSLTRDNKTVNNKDTIFVPWWNKLTYEPHAFKVDQLKSKNGVLPGFLFLATCQSECDHLNALLNTP